MEPGGRRPSRNKLEEEMREVKQGLLLTIVVCRVCNGDRRIRVIDNRQGGIVAQLGECPKCGTGGGNHLSPLDNNAAPADDKTEENAKGSTDGEDKRKPRATMDGSKTSSTVTFQRSPSPPGPPEPLICRSCRMDPCIFTRLQHDIMLHDSAINTVQNQPSYPMAGVVRNRQRRHRAFRYATYRLYGYLGKNNRKRMPRCIEDGIRSLYPAYNGLHVGYKPGPN